MADMFKIDVKGVKELQAKFANMDKEFQKMLSQATSAAGAVVVREAKINSGRGGGFPNRVTGNLMRSIREVRKSKSSTRCVSEVGSDMKYAARLEFGFMDTDRLGRRYHQAARPYLRPALDDNEEEIQRAFDEGVKRILEKYK